MPTEELPAATAAPKEAAGRPQQQAIQDASGPAATSDQEALVPADAEPADESGQERSTGRPAGEGRGAAVREAVGRASTRAINAVRSTFRNDLVDSHPDDAADLGLAAHLHRKEFDEKGVAFNNAVELSLQAIDVARRGPAGTEDLRTGMYTKTACGCIFTIILVLLMLISARGYTRVVTAHDGILVAGGANAVRHGAMRDGDELIISTAKVLERKTLAETAALPVQSLRNVRDVTFVHDGVWRCIHVTRAQKLGYGHVLLEAADGTAVRLLEDQATIRFGHGGVEEPLSTDEVEYEDYSGLLAGRIHRIRPFTHVEVNTRWNP